MLLLTTDGEVATYETFGERGPFRFGNEEGRRDFLLLALAWGGVTARIPLTASQSPRTTADASVRGLATANSDFFVRNHFHGLTSATKPGVSM